MYSSNMLSDIQHSLPDSVLLPVILFELSAHNHSDDVGRLHAATVPTPMMGYSAPTESSEAGLHW